MKAPITTAQAMSHPDVALTINTLGQMADELRAEIARLQDLLKDALANVNEITDVKNAEIERLRTAAQAVVDRWGTPLWKDAPATAIYINTLRNALEAK